MRPATPQRRRIPGPVAGFALYARVHFCLRKSHARPRVQQAPGLPCALSSRGGQTKMQTSGAMRREIAKVHHLFEIGSEISFVVPAKAGTHNHWPQLVYEVLV